MNDLVFNQEELESLEAKVQLTIRHLRQLQEIFGENVDADLDETIGALNRALDKAHDESREYYGQNEPSPLQEAVADYQRMEIAALKGEQ